MIFVVFQKGKEKRIETEAMEEEYSRRIFFPPRGADGEDGWGEILLRRGKTSAGITARIDLSARQKNK